MDELSHEATSFDDSNLAAPLPASVVQMSAASAIAQGLADVRGGRVTEACLVFNALRAEFDIPR